MIDSIDLIERGQTFVNLMNAVFAKESQPLTADYCGSHESRDVQCFSVDELLLHFEAIFEKVIKQHLAAAVKMNED